MSNEITYMDCWYFIAPLIPVNTDYTMDIYVMVFNGEDQAENLLQFGVSESPRSESRQKEIP